MATPCKTQFISSLVRPALSGESEWAWKWKPESETECESHELWFVSRIEIGIGIAASLGIAHCSMPQGVIVCGTHNALTHTHIQTHTHTISDHLLRTERAPLPSAAPPPLFNLLPAKCVQSDRSFGQIKRRFAGSPAHSSSLHSLHSQLVPYRHYIYVWHIVEASLYIYLYRITPNTASAWNCSRDLIESILKCW